MSERTTHTDRLPGEDVAVKDVNPGDEVGAGEEASGGGVASSGRSLAALTFEAVPGGVERESASAEANSGNETLPAVAEATAVVSEAAPSGSMVPVAQNLDLINVSAARHTGSIRPARKSIMMSAVMVLESLDPVPAEAEQGKGGESGEVVLPGWVPLAPLTLLATVLQISAFVWLDSLAVMRIPDYRVPFWVAGCVLVGHIWSYHVAYHTRQRFMAWRQLLFMSALVGFFGWILLDLELQPELVVDVGAPKALHWGVGLSVAAVGLVWLHALILGRGHRVRRFGARKD
jgi:hypothetical protein